MSLFSLSPPFIFIKQISGGNTCQVNKKKTQTVRLIPTKCRAAQQFLSQFVHGVSRCGCPLCSLAPTLLKTKVLQRELAKAW